MDPSANVADSSDGPTGPPGHEPSRRGRKRAPFVDISQLDDPEERKRQLRLVKNRRTAAISRARRQEKMVMLESRVSALEEENARLRAALDAQKVAPPSSMTAPYSVIGDRMQSTATLPTPEQGRPRQPERSGPSSSMERSTRTASDASGSRFSGVRPPLPHHPTPVSVRVSHRAGSSSPLGPRGNASLGEAVATIAEVSGGTPRAVPTPLEQPPHPRRPPALSAQGTAPSMMEQTLASGAAPDSSAASGPTRPMASFARFLTVEIPGGGTACPEETLASADTPQDQVIPAVASPDVKQQPPGSGGTGSSGASAAARRSTTPGATHGFPWPLGGRGGPGSSLALSDEALLAWSPSSAVSAAAATIARATTSDGSPSPLSLLLSSPGPSHNCFEALEGLIGPTPRDAATANVPTWHAGEPPSRSSPPDEPLLHPTRPSNPARVRALFSEPPAHLPRENP